MSDTGVAPNKVYQRTDGVRTGSAVNQQAQAAGAKNTAAYADARENDIATALNNRIMRDGGNQAAANLPMGGYKHTGVADATANNEYASKGQMDIAIAAAVAAAVAAVGSDLEDAIDGLGISASGTSILCFNSSAPTGWTIDTSFTDCAVRLHTTGGTGGSAGFADMFSASSSVTPAGTVGNTTLTAVHLPVTCPWSASDAGHDHGISATLTSGANTSTGSYSDFHRYSPNDSYTDIGYANISMSTNILGGNAHSHTLSMSALNMPLKYMNGIKINRN